MKSDSHITSYTPTGLLFADGSHLPADVIIFCTGFVGNIRSDVRKLFGPQVADSVEDFWGVDNEGELKGAFKPCGREYNPTSPYRNTYAQTRILSPTWLIPSNSKPPSLAIIKAWYPSPDPGLWYTGGTISHARYCSRFVALQIKTAILGTPLSVYGRMPSN